MCSSPVPNHEITLLSFFFIYGLIKAAEAGNLEEFIRLYQFDNTRLAVRDGKGRTVAHQAAAKNKINILQYIREQNGGNLINLSSLSSH